MLPNFLADLVKQQSYNPDNFFDCLSCVVESEEMVMEIADKVSGICKRLEIPYIFKASYRKANRTSASSFTGLGDDLGLDLIKKVGTTFNLPTTSDVHAHDECAMAAEYIDILQIPAFLCRQTDLLLAAADTNKIVNVKKGQFLSGKYAICC
jgi:2-dehydro-3-deoxyphosphooctonate aldolase (KDO 8-P synthase)